jgi:hypothetical protein
MSPGLPVVAVPIRPLCVCALELHGPENEITTSEAGLSNAKSDLSSTEIHRYQREGDCSGHIGMQKIHFDKTGEIVSGTNKVVWMRWHEHWVNGTARYNEQTSGKPY